MNITELRLVNFRRFEDFRLTFRPNFNLIVGENASGKTAVLEASALVCSNVVAEAKLPPKRKEIDKRDIRHRTFRVGQTVNIETQYPCRLEVRGSFAGQEFEWGAVYAADGGMDWSRSEELRQSAKNLRDSVRYGEPVDLPVVAYFGTERLCSDSKNRGVIDLDIGSRLEGYRRSLEPTTRIAELNGWFRDQEFMHLQNRGDAPLLDGCRRAIVTCIPGAGHIYFDSNVKEILFEVGGQYQPLSSLSDGYRSTLAMVADIAIRCGTLNPHLGSDAPKLTSGIVLIDEIDLHLHPRWQRSIVADLMEAFPRIQFIVTSHSPFIIRAMPENKTTALINLDEGKESTVGDKSVEDIAEWIQGVDQPQRSARYVQMMNKAQQYFQMLQDGSGVSDEERLAVREELQRLTAPFGDSPAFHALVRMRELVAEDKKNTERSKTQDRASRYIDLDDSRTKNKDDNSGMAGGEM